MKKQSRKLKKENALKENGPSPKQKRRFEGKAGSNEGKASKVKASKPIAKKTQDRKKEGEGSVFRYVAKAGQFLREAKVELKKVKWPTRKELLATTAVVIVLVILISFFLGLVDFGLIKVIKKIVG